MTTTPETPKTTETPDLRPHDSRRIPSLVVAGALLAALAAGSQALGWAQLDDLAGLCLAAALLGAGVLFQVHWMLTRWASSAWLVLGTTCLGAYLGVTNVAQLLGPGSRAPEAWLERAAFVTLLMALAVTGGRHLTVRWRVSPLRFGLLTGAIVAGVVVALQVGIRPATTPDPVVRWLLIATSVLAGGYLTALVQRQLGTSVAIRLRLATAALALTGAAAAQMVSPGFGPAVVVLDAVAAATILGAARALVGRSIRNQHRALDTMRTSLEEQAVADRGRQSALHEIRATIGGLAQALQVLHQPGVPAHRREVLQQLVEEELQRLSRLTQPQRPEAGGAVDLDAALENVVLRHRLHGQQVLWQPSGHRVWARADDVVTIVGTLLDNSRVHAPGSVCVVEISTVEPAQVAVRVSDTGRGVSSEVRERVFTWQGKDDVSAGQGIGLATARRLARDNAGDLQLSSQPGRGASFVLLLPAAGRALRLSELIDADVQQLA